MATTDREPRRCPRCGARVAQQAQSCLLCGQELRSSGYLQPALALIAVAIVAGAVVAGLRDRSLSSEAASDIVVTPVGSTALALAPPTSTTEAVTFASGTAVVSTATPIPVTPTYTPVPTDTETPTPAPTDTPTPTPGPRVHVVQAGDVLGTIALQYGLGVDDILAANPDLTERSLLRLGQEIVIPAGSAPEAAAAAEAPPTAPSVHIIESGDNLLYLAEKYNTSVDEILALNPGLTETSLLRPGQEINIPAPASQTAESVAATPAPEPTATPEPQFMEHSIESGDSLGYLARTYNTSVDAILAANPGLTEYSVLSIGQKIRIPAPPQSGGPDPTPTPAPSAAISPTPESTSLAAATASLMSLGGPAQPRALEPLSPRGGARVASSELILMWTGVGDLAPDLWYVVHLWRVGEPNDTLTGWTRATSWRPTEDLLARWGADAHLFWDVGIGREIAVAGTGQPRFESAGPRTEPQDFYLVVK